MDISREGDVASVTDFRRVKAYYQKFDESSRLSADSSGRLEFEMTMRILQRHLPARSRILDLGGATGVYSFPLAQMGHEVWLADLSENLIEQARAQNADGRLKSCDVVNAIDLSRYADGFFDAVLLLGPLYHLTDPDERQRCVREVRRVLRDEGTVIAAFIPHLSGSIAIVDRYLRRPEQVNVENLEEVFKTGRFVNASAEGFQEGYYPTSGEIEALFADHGFQRMEIRSVRGFGYEKEDALYSMDDVRMRDKIMELIEETAGNPAIIETCGHAVYVGSQRKELCMDIELRKLSAADGRDVYDMLQAIPKDENGFMNGVNGMDYEAFKAWLSREDANSKKTEIEDGWKVPQSTFWLYVDGRPVGIGKIRHFLTDKLRQEGGHIGYAIAPDERSKGYGKILLGELLKAAKNLGIEHALVTVRNENTASVKVALANGGVAEKMNDARHFIWIDC